MADAVQLDTAGSDVSGEQGADLTGRERRQVRASLLARSLVLVKISTRNSPLAMVARTFTRSAGMTVSRWWAISGRAETASTACRAGWLRKRPARMSTAPSRVAENNGCCPSRGVLSSSVAVAISRSRTIAEPSSFATHTSFASVPAFPAIDPAGHLPCGPQSPRPSPRA